MDRFLLPVVYKGEAIELESKLLPSTFMHRFEVYVQGMPLIFERDDEGNFRAINYNQDTETTIDIDMLAAIVESLHAITEQ